MYIAYDIFKNNNMYIVVQIVISGMDTNKTS